MRTPRSVAWQRFEIVSDVVLPSLIAVKISSSIEDLIASVSWYALIALKKRSG
jgi:hypothetical protein